MNGGDIGGGSASKGGNANKGGTQGSGAGLGAGDGGKVGDQYAGVIKREIQRRFLKDPSFAGKVCSIKIQLGRDGTILGYQRVSGPDDICTAALSAVARTKKFQRHHLMQCMKNTKRRLSILISMLDNRF